MVFGNTIGLTVDSWQHTDGDFSFKKGAKQLTGFGLNCWCIYEYNNYILN